MVIIWLVHKEGVDEVNGIFTAEDEKGGGGGSCKEGKGGGGGGGGSIDITLEFALFKLLLLLLVKLEVMLPVLPKSIVLVSREWIVNSLL